MTLKLKRLAAALFAIGFTLNASAADDVASPAASSAVSPPASSIAPAAEIVAPPPGTHATASIVPSPITEAEALAIPQLVNNADLWERIRRGFVMNELNMPAVQNHEQYYAQKQDYI